MTTAPQRSRRPCQVDDIGAPWARPTPVGTEGAVLPGHPWIGRIPLLAGGAEVTVGASWIVCVDLVAEADYNDRPLVSLRGLRSSIRYLGRPVEREEIPELEGFWRPLVPIPAGTPLRVREVGGSVTWDYGGNVSSFLRFDLPDGRTLTLTTAKSSGELAAQADIAAGRESGGAWGLTWGEIASAAVVVPVDHPVATSSAECAALLARIERTAALSVGHVTWPASGNPGLL